MPIAAYSLFLTLLLLVPCYTIADWKNAEGHPLPETSARKSAGDFGANLFIINKKSVAFKTLSTPSSLHTVSSAETVKRKEYLTLFVMFSGCHAGKNGNCDLRVKFKILQPNGAVYVDIPMQDAWLGKPAEGQSLKMSVDYVVIRIEDHDPLGMYEVTADVIDQVSSKTLSLSLKFNVIK